MVQVWKLCKKAGENTEILKNGYVGLFLCNTFGTKSLLHARTESSNIVAFMVKFIWQHNLPVGSYGTFKMPPGRLDAEM